MYGAYQAGVWSVLSRVFKPDMVVGASVGALNGWAIASECAPEALMERWLDPVTARGITDLQGHTEMLFSQFQPRIPYGLVMLGVRGLKPELVRHPDVTATHLRASCSIPFMLPSVVIDGRRYVDGGIFERMPVWAAVEMGATRIIAVDAMPEWPLLRALPRKRVLPADLNLTLIKPSESPGVVRDGFVWKRENIERLIALGQRDAGRVYATNSPE
jgi:NTE family protein